MKTLLERVLGRRSRDEREADVASAPAERGGSTSTVAEVPGPAASRASVIQALQSHIAAGSRGRLTAPEIHEDAQLFDRGYLDSFSYVEFLAFIEHTYRVRIDDSQLAGHLNTLAAMADHILREQTSPAE